MMSITAISAVVLAAGPVRAQPTDAKQLFDEARALETAGHTAQACAMLEESNLREPNAGALFHLGRCREQLGQLASALAAFHEAFMRAIQPQKKQLAQQYALAAAARVSRLEISVPVLAQAEGLTVECEGRPIEPASHGHSLPVDGGTYKISAHAPGYQPWSTTVEVGPERDLVSVTVPRLVEEAAIARTGLDRLTGLRRAQARNPLLDEELRALPAPVLPRLEISEPPPPLLRRTVPINTARTSGRTLRQTAAWSLLVVGAACTTYALLRATTGGLEDDRSFGYRAGAVGLTSGLAAIPALYFAY